MIDPLGAIAALSCRTNLNTHKVASL